MFGPVLHSAVFEELVILGSFKPIRLPCRLTSITGQVVSGAEWILREDDNRFVFVRTHRCRHRSLHPPTLSDRLPRPSAAGENGSRQYTYPSSLHWNLLSLPAAKTKRYDRRAVFIMCSVDAKLTRNSIRGCGLSHMGVNGCIPSCWLSMIARPIIGIDGKRFRSIPHTGEPRGGRGGW